MTVKNNSKPTPQPDEKRSRRGSIRHRINPFVEDAAIATRTKVRRVANTRGDQLMVVSENTGEVLAPAGFWHAQTVDRTQFVKLYINGVKAFKELSAAGTRVFELLYLAMQSNVGKDRLLLAFHDIDQAANPISEATFYRGMKELVSKSFLAESMVQNFYFVNPDYLWNGDRLAFVKEYRLKGSKERDHLTGDLFEGLPALTESSPPEAEVAVPPASKAPPKKAAPKPSKKARS